ncbi:hypothetical protein [Helicobacter pylori]|nr:hypothetical protein [Helicobacter pylori]
MSAWGAIFFEAVKEANEIKTPAQKQKRRVKKSENFMGNESNQK